MLGETKKTWFFDGVEYDFRSFVHPGWDGIVEALQGAEVKDVVVQYHPDIARVKKSMAKYEATATTTTTTTLTIPTTLLALPEDHMTSSGLHRELQELLFNALGKNRENWKWPLGDFLCFLALGLYALGYSSWRIHSGLHVPWWFAVNVLSSIVFANRIVHEASHRTLPKLWKLGFLNDAMVGLLVSVSSPHSCWLFDHIVLHHGRTNLRGYDVDAIPSTTTKSWSAWGSFGAPIFYTTTQGIFASGAVPGTAPPRLSTRLLDAVLLATATGLSVWFLGLFVTLALAISKAFVFSFVGQVSHLQPEVLREGSPSLNYDSERNYLDKWVRNQAATTVNFSTQSDVAWWLSFGLSHQIEHHVLPAVSHYHYRALSPEVRRIFAKYNVPYIEKSFWRASMDCLTLMLPSPKR